MHVTFPSLTFHDPSWGPGGLVVGGTCVVFGASGVVLTGISAVLLVEVSDGVVERDVGIGNSVEELVLDAGIVDVSCPIAKLMMAEIEILNEIFMKWKTIKYISHVNPEIMQ